MDAWPGFAPGDRGVLNTMAPTHFRIDGLPAVEPKPPVLWLRGADDVIVSDTSLYDLAYLGSIGAVPGWPGAEAWPPQPMVAQTRAVLDGYAAAGGRYREVVIDDASHGPHWSSRSGSSPNWTSTCPAPDRFRRARRRRRPHRGRAGPGRHPSPTGSG